MIHSASLRCVRRSCVTKQRCFLPMMEANGSDVDKTAVHGGVDVLDALAACAWLSMGDEWTREVRSSGSEE